MQRNFIPIITIPKSGTNFVNQIMQHIFGIYYSYQLFTGRPEQLLPFISKLETPKRELDDPQSNYWCGCTTHIPFDKELAKFLTDHPNRIRPIFVIRDPRDIVVSYVRGAHLGLFPAPGFVSMQKKEVPIQQQYVQYIDQLTTQIPERIMWSSQPSMLVLKYEHLISSADGGALYQQGETIDRIASHLKVDSFRVARSILSNNFFLFSQ